MDGTFETFYLGDWELQSGQKLEKAHLAYKTFGHSESPAIVYPTWFSGCKRRFMGIEHGYESLTAWISAF